MMACHIRRTPLSQGILSFTNDEVSSDHNSISRSSQQSQLPKKDERLSPRQHTPTKSVVVSKPDYMRELSLSDADSDIRNSPPKVADAKKNLKLSHVYQEVLSTEIDGEQDFSRSGEVSVKTYKIQSPARVICHSPSALSLRDDGDEGGVVGVGDDAQQKLRVERLEQGKPKSLSFNASSDDSMVRDNKSKNNGSMEVVSKANISSGNSTKKKKKKFIQVESRFKQASKKHQQQSETLKSKSLELSAITPHHVSNTNNHNHNSSQHHKKSRVTSTPFLMTSVYEGQAANDGTILEQTRFQSEPNIKRPLTKTTSSKSRKDKDSVMRKETSSKKKDHSKDTSKETKGNIENEQLLVDLRHARKLQITYLDMKARQTFDKQQEKAKNEMYALWALNRKLEKETEALTLAVNARRMEIAVDQLLNAQIEGFKLIPDKLPGLVMRSNVFSETLSNISHYLDVDAVTIGNQETLLASLDESKRLLAEISSLTRRRQPQIEELSTSNEVLMKTVKNELHEQTRCSELISACSSLVNKELSLQAQMLQT